MKMDVEQILSHFSLSDFYCGGHERIKDYMVNTAFLKSRYIFTERQGKKRNGFCTHCRNWFPANEMRHNAPAHCPKCGSWCIIKASGVKRTRLVDQAYVTWFEKSIIDPQVITALGIYAVRDYRDRFYNVETKYLIRTLYVFKMGEPAMAKKWGFYSAAQSMTFGDFELTRSVYPLDNHTEMINIPSFVSQDSIRAAVCDTPYQYSGWDKYEAIPEAMIKFFDSFSRWPCIEYLTKLGFTNLVKDKLYDGRTYGAINWRGNTLKKVLGLTKKDLAGVKKAGITIDALYIKLHRISLKDGSNLSPDELHQLTKIYDGTYFSTLETMLKTTGSTLRRATDYLRKQYHLQASKNRYYEHEPLITWRDYINDCITLHFDLTDEKVVFPRDLHRAHQNTIKQVKNNANEILNEKIKNRLGRLNEKYYFEYLGLFIRPADSSGELIVEGKALSHCVGTYAERYAKGETDLFVIRRITDPETPFYTAEIRKDIITQVRGKNNRPADDEVSAFIEAFRAEKLQKKQVENRVKISIPA